MVDQGIHGGKPISWQIDRAIQAGKVIGRPIARIVAAPPLVENLVAEWEDKLFAELGGDGLTRYCGIVIETQPLAETGWVAYDEHGVMIDKGDLDG